MSKKRTFLIWRPISKAIFLKTPKIQEREMEDGSFLQQNQFHFENWMRSTIPHAMLSIKLPRLPLNSYQYLLIIFPLAWLFAFCTLWASCTQLSNIRRNNFFSDPSAMCMALLFNTLASVRKRKKKATKALPTRNLYVLKCRFVDDFRWQVR